MTNIPTPPNTTGRIPNATHAKAPQAGVTEPGAKVVPAASGAVLALSGEWSVHTLRLARQNLEKLQLKNRQLASIDLNNITRLDTSGALLINQYRKISGSRLASSKLAVTVDNADYTALLDFCPEPTLPEAEKKHAFLTVLCNSIGHSIVTELSLLWEMLGFLGHFLCALSHVLLKPWNMRWTSLIYHMEQTGLKAIGIVGLLSFLIGLVIAYMAAAQLVLFGMQIFVVPLLEIATTREMAVLITAILVAGRSGSSFTAQIGAMVANEEVDAMRTMGLNPMQMLVVPRILALVLMLPVMVMVADIMSILGGMTAVWVSMDITPTVFFYTLHKNMSYQNFLLGLLKTPFFAVAIGCVGCFLGFKVTGSSESVGQLTTKAVVEAIFLVIVLDAVFALLFSALKI